MIMSNKIAYKAFDKNESGYNAQQATSGDKCHTRLRGLSSNQQAAG